MSLCSKDDIERQTILSDESLKICITLDNFRIKMKFEGRTFFHPSIQVLYNYSILPGLDKTPGLIDISSSEI